MKAESTRRRHNISRSSWLLGGIVGLVQMVTVEAAPLALHPGNPHYFLLHGQPTVLIGSGEHYGAVLNLDFDYVPYLQTLEKDHLNLTRTFTGAYVEPVGAFNITGNTLAPAPQRLICPWARSDTAGYAKGGSKFDLSRWDEAFFKRLRAFVQQARKRGVVVEINFFTPFYEENIWALSPMKAENNVNGWGDIARTNVYTLDRNGALLGVQESMVRKIVKELNGFENLYYELCNEPYFGGVTLDWQRHMADTIVATERQLPYKHLISQNIANDKAEIRNPNPSIAIFNFHYASPPATVGMNYGLNKVIGENETGFHGTNDTHYRKEAWQFILAGGGLFNNLDYSFTVGHERGDFVYPAQQPGGGNSVYRSQLGTLRGFIQRFAFTKMRPDSSAIRLNHPDQISVHALIEPGRQYAAYFFGGTRADVTLELPRGRFSIEWLNPITGRIDAVEKANHPGGLIRLASPEYLEDVALRIVKI